MTQNLSTKTFRFPAIRYAVCRPRKLGTMVGGVYGETPAW
jgi:hypothetical protein